jgi:hypothetical protein
MKFVNDILFGAVVVAALAGCSKSEDALDVQAPSPAPTVSVSASAVPVAPEAPRVEAPPQAAAAPGILPATADAEVKLQDADGKTLSAIEFMNMAAENYERTRAGMTEGDVWPPLTSLDQLVRIGFLRKLPAAPAGQKFQLNPETRKVMLVPQ